MSDYSLFENAELVGAAAIDILNPFNWGKGVAPLTARLVEEQNAEHEGRKVSQVTIDLESQGGLKKITKAADKTVTTVIEEVKHDVGGVLDGGAWIATHWKPLLVGIAIIGAIGVVIVYVPPIAKAAKAVLP